MDVGIFGTVMPDAKLHIIFLPMVTFTASAAIKVRRGTIFRKVVDFGKAAY
jgi:hypothetical protein